MSDVVAGLVMPHRVPVTGQYPAHIGTKAYPLRYSGGVTSALGDRQCARFPQERRFRGESGALAHIRRGHCTEVDTPFGTYGLLRPTVTSHRDAF